MPETDTHREDIFIKYMDGKRKYIGDAIAE